MTIHVVGEGIIPEARAFDRVKEALEFDKDVYLGAMWSKWLGYDLPKGSVVYNMEPLYEGCRSFSIGYLDVLKDSIVVDYSRNNVDYLKTLGIEAFHLPYGYHKSLERVKQTKNKCIDFLLVGSQNPRRIEIVNRLRQKFNVVWVTGAYGEDLDHLVSISKVILNIHFIEEHPLEVARLNYLMANRCTVVSEWSDDKEVDMSYSNGIYFSDDLENMCEYALHHPLDGYSCIKEKQMDCSKANTWVNNTLKGE